MEWFYTDLGGTGKTEKSKACKGVKIKPKIVAFANFASEHSDTSARTFEILHRTGTVSQPAQAKQV
jgi:hypothetical protein